MTQVVADSILTPGVAVRVDLAGGDRGIGVGLSAPSSRA